MNYKIYRRKKKIIGKVKYSQNLPYVFNPSYHKNDSIIDINKLSIYNQRMINNILVKKYIRKYKNLLKMVYLLFQDAFPGDTGFPAVIGEIDKQFTNFNNSRSLRSEREVQHKPTLKKQESVIGKMVVHAEMGSGVVIAENNNILTVAFKTKGIKNVARDFLRFV